MAHGFLDLAQVGPRFAGQAGMLVGLTATDARGECVDDDLGQGHGAFSGAGLGWANDDAAFHLGRGAAHMQPPAWPG